MTEAWFRWRRGASIPYPSRFLKWRAARPEGLLSSEAKKGLETRIRERAYALWEADGRPEDRANGYWERARRLIEAETDLKTLADATNEAAKHESGQWFYFVTIMITLTAIVGSTTHRVLLLSEPVKVPILSIELPLLGFYGTAPAIFVVLHFYVLAQLGQLATKLRTFLDVLARESEGQPEARSLAVQRLDTFPIVQLLVSERLGTHQVQVRLMAWFTLAIAPLLLLIFFQLRFLPYHDVPMTWWHRLLLTLDVVLIWWLWPTSAGRLAGRFWFKGAIRWGAAATILLFSWILGTVPGERLDSIATHLPGRLGVFRPRPPDGPLAVLANRVAAATGFRRDELQAPEKDFPRENVLPKESLMAALRRALFDGGVDEDTQQPRSFFARSLVLPDQVLIGAEDIKAFRDNPENALEIISRTTVLRGRDLREARLDRADLRRADLTAAHLQGSQLAGAKLAGASLDRAQLNDAVLDGAQLQGASLNGAQLQGASLIGTQLQGVSLNEAQMQGALLSGAQLQGALFYRAQMQGVFSIEAQLQGALLSEAELQGASLLGAQLQGALLNGAKLQGASFSGADMQGASLNEAELQGAELDDTNLQAATLVSAVAWRTSAVHADLKNANLEGLSFSAEAPERPWQSWTDLWLARIPFGLGREVATNRFKVLTRELDPRGETELRATWPDPLPKSPPDPQDVVDSLRTLACAAEHAPYVARGILAQLALPIWNNARYLDAAVGPLLAQLADPESCPGARGFTDTDRAVLARVTRDTAQPSPPNASVTPKPTLPRFPLKQGIKTE